MAKKYVGENTLKKVMDLGIKLFPSKELTTDEMTNMWNYLGHDERLDHFTYSLNKTNKTVTISKLLDTDLVDLEIANQYFDNGEVYTTVLDGDSLFASSSKTLQSVTFEDGIICKNLKSAFTNCSKLENVIGFNKLNLENATLNYVFYSCSSLETLDLSGIDLNKVTFSSSMLTRCSNFNSINISGIKLKSTNNGIFNIFGSTCKEFIGLGDIDTSEVTNMGNLFYNCSSVTSLDFTGWDTSKVTDMSSMFGCGNIISLDLTSFDTSNVTDMSNMFSGCTKLTEVKVSRSKFKLPSGTEESSLFSNCGCSALTYVD